MTTDELITEIQIAIVSGKIGTAGAPEYVSILRQRIADSESPKDAASRISDLVDSLRTLATQAMDDGRSGHCAAYDAVWQALKSEWPRNASA